ncbi:MAG: isoprenylcysteine carboxylmethyltransferase family protein [Silicimonas sp.]|nr:isoprenylcysteine carboxylmethyltransferase family protein [Silicimonas sp.]
MPEIIERRGHLRNKDAGYWQLLTYPGPLGDVEMGMKWIDLPPVWLLGALGLAWALPVRFGPGGLIWLGWACLGVGTVLVVLALHAFVNARTTFMPREEPKALITGGIFSRLRNPIYLADLLFLAGASLIWGSLAGLFLVIPFALVLHHRFIRGEEEMLRAHFGTEYDDYVLSTRRWF